MVAVFDEVRISSRKRGVPAMNKCRGFLGKTHGLLHKGEFEYRFGYGWRPEGETGNCETNDISPPRMVLHCVRPVFLINQSTLKTNNNRKNLIPNSEDNITTILTGLAAKKG